MCKYCDELIATLDRLDPIVGTDGPKLPDPAPLPNALELEYAILSLFINILATGSLTTSQYGNERVFSFPCANGQRANIRIETKDMVYCSLCAMELINPDYRQTTHTKCQKLEDERAQSVQLAKESYSAGYTETPA